MVQLHRTGFRYIDHAHTARDAGRLGTVNVVTIRLIELSPGRFAIGGESFHRQPGTVIETDLTVPTQGVRFVAPPGFIRENTAHAAVGEEHVEARDHAGRILL